MGVDGFIYEGVVEPSYKNLLGHVTTVLVTVGKIEEKLVRRILTMIWVRALEITKSNMQISRQENREPVLSTTLGILLTNARS